MFRRRLLTAALVVFIAGCGTNNTQPHAPESTQKVKLIGVVVSTVTPTTISTAAAGGAPTVIPLATTPVGGIDPLAVKPLVDALNAAWEPLIDNLATTVSWADIDVQLLTTAERADTYCRPEYTFDATAARGTYCVAPVSNRVGAPHAYILLPQGHFKGEVERLAGDKKLAVALAVAYFYTLHLRKSMDLGDVIEGPWSEESQTQWCLTGMGLRALGVFTTPSPLPTLASQSAAPDVLPLGLTHTFSKVTPKTEHTGWVLDGFNTGTLANCFA